MNVFRAARSLGLALLAVTCLLAAPAHAFVTGALEGHVLFNGAPVTPSAMSGPGALAVQVGAGNAVSVDGTGFYRFPNLPIGAYLPAVTVGASTLAQGAPTPTTVAGTATTDVDVTGAAGLATGVITVNGQPFPLDRVTVDVNGTTCAFATDAGAGFTLLLPQGSYTAVPRSNATGTPIGSFPFTVLTGQATSLGTIALTTGALQGYVLFNGAPPPPQTFAGAGAVRVQAGEGISVGVGADGSYQFPNLPVGTYHPLAMAGASALGAAATTLVTAGGTAAEYLDVTSSAGIAAGVIAVNGQPYAVDRIAVVGAGVSCVFGTNAGARFQMLLPPGSYTATPYSSTSGAALGTFPVAVTAGVSTDLGTLAFSTGAIEGHVLFNGAPVPALAMIGFGALTVQAGAGITANVDATGYFRFPDLPASTYPLVLLHGANALGAGATTPVSAGATATAYLDVTSSAGLATGLVAVNGAPFAVDRMTVAGNGASYDFSTDGAGRFLLLLPPGSYTAIPRSNATGAPIGTFTFDVVAGATNGVASATPGPAIAAFALLPVSPNPATAHSLVSFNVPRRAHVRVTLLDVQGRERAVLADGVHEAGHYTIALPSGELHAGMYFVRMQAPGNVLTRRVAIVK